MIRFIIFVFIAFLCVKLINVCIDIFNHSQYHVFIIRNNELLEDSKIQHKHINNRIYQFSLILKDVISSIQQQHALNFKIGYVFNDLGKFNEQDEKFMSTCDIILNPVNTFPTKRKSQNPKIIQLGSFVFQHFGKDEY